MGRIHRSKCIRCRLLPTENVVLMKQWFGATFQTPRAIRTLSRSASKRAVVGASAAITSSQGSFSQWLFFGRNIGQLTPKIVYFHYLRKCFLDQSIQKKVYLILKKKSTGFSSAIENTFVTVIPRLGVKSDT